MTGDDRKMVEALIQHLGQKIDQISDCMPTPLGQILAEELKVSFHRLKTILMREHGAHDLPQSQAQNSTPAAALAPKPNIELSLNLNQSVNPLSPPEPAGRIATETGVPANKKVLFLIDDDKDAQKVLSYMFERKSSFRVVSHTEPLKAWEEIKASPPDVILMDLMMPGISGLDLLKNIRQIPELKHIKILIGSSKSFDKDRIEVLKAGANDFIAKPYNFTELLLRLNKLAG